jgi:hypothetical protein
VSGFNDEVTLSGAVYMVQTQDMGPRRRRIETTIYRQGLLVKRRQYDYGHLIGSADFEEARREKMENMHRQAMTDIEAGKLGSRP